MPAIHFHDSSRDLPWKYILCTVPDAQFVLDDFRAAGCAMAGASLWKDNSLGKALYVVGGLGFVLANHHLRGRYLLESCGYANCQVCEMVRREMCGRKEVMI
jgi:hypothetical protein